MSVSPVTCLIAFASAAAVSGLSLPLWRKACVRVGLVDDPGARKIHSEPIPLAGGLAITTGMLLGLAGILMAGWAGWPGDPAANRAGFDPGQRPAFLLAILGGALGMLALGLADDRVELRPAVKFAGQFLIALGVAASGLRITLFVPSLTFSYAVTILWILTVTNAFNFMDNMNGLCTGLGLIAAGCFGLMAFTRAQPLAALTAFLAAGALLGFLPHNFPRARSFLGDGGSHLVGFLASVLAILPHFYSAQRPHRWAVLAPVLVLAVPLLDLVWVVILRWQKGTPFYVGDTNHLSHRLVRRGLSPAAAVGLIWLLALGGGALAFCL